MTITSEERELLDMLHKAMPERKNLMLITLTAGAHLDGITRVCSFHNAAGQNTSATSKPYARCSTQTPPPTSGR